MTFHPALSTARPKAGRFKAMKYVVVYEKSATGWSAYVPDLPGVIATGSTKEETQRLIREVIELHLDGLREDNIPIPEPSASPEVVSVS
jgi:predicted RNase H-like HicB family nuclease